MRIPRERVKKKCSIDRDILFTGRTIRAALDALLDSGR